MKLINEHIAINLKTLRKDRNFTLEDLSDICGVSRSMIGEIERGSTNPTILVLWKIANGLKIPLTTLIQEEQPDYYVVKHEDEVILNNTDEYNISTIFPYYKNHKSEFLRLEINPNGAITNAGHMNGVDEYLYVIKGKLKLKLNNEIIELSIGDSIRFNGEISHELHNDSTVPLELINIIYYDTGIQRI